MPNLPNAQSRLKRPRATVIVEINGLVLLTEDRDGKILFPGGGIENRELPLIAAARELLEETGLVSVSMTYLFDHTSFSNQHHVFWGVAKGVPEANDDAFKLHFLTEKNFQMLSKMSPATREILAKYQQLKGSNLGVFSELTRMSSSE